MSFQKWTRHLKLDIVLAIPALDEWKINEQFSCAVGLTSMTPYHAKDLCASELGPLMIYALYKFYWLID